MKTIKWGILSTARIAEEQLIPALQAAQNAEVIAVASRDENKARSFAERNNIRKSFGSYEQLLDDPEIEAVYIPLPNHLHAEWTIRAAEKGKHILCEKPIAINAEQARKMAAVCQHHNVKLMEAFMYQFHPQWNRVKEVIRQGDIGNVKIINAAFSFLLTDRDDIRLNDLTGGGALYDVGSYCVHASRLITDSEPAVIKSLAKQYQHSTVDMTLCAILEFPNHCLVHFDCSFECAERQYVEIVGEQGVIKVTLPFRPDKGKPEVHITRNGRIEVEEFPETNPYLIQVEHFSSCILHDQQPIYTPENAIANMEAIDQIYKAVGRS